jgi:hypothetical protein
LRMYKNIAVIVKAKYTIDDAIRRISPNITVKIMSVGWNKLKHLMVILGHSFYIHL